MFKRITVIIALLFITSAFSQIKEFRSISEDGKWKPVLNDKGTLSEERGEFIVKQNFNKSQPKNTRIVTLTINFNTDQPPDFVIFNQSTFYSSSNGSWSPDHYTFTVDVAEGTYDMIFINFQHTNWVVKELVACTTNTSVNVHFDNDPIHEITLAGVDHNGVSLDTYPRPSRIGINLFAPEGSEIEYVSIFNLNKSVLKFSGLSNRYTIFLDEFQDAIFETKEYWLVQFNLITGLNSNLTVQNSPSEFRNQKVSLNNKTTPYYFVSFSHDYIEKYDKYCGGVGMSFIFMDSTENYTASVYITPDKSSRIAYSTKMGYMESNGQYPTMPGYFGQNMFVKETSNYIYSTFLPVHTPDVYESPAGSTFNLGTGPAYPYMFYPNNYYNTVNIGSNPRFCGSLKEYRVSDNIRSTYSIYNSENAVISSGDLSAFQPMDVAAGAYRFETVNPFVKVNGHNAVSKVITTFDLTRQDATPPFITSYKLLNQAGVFTDRLNKGETGTLKFSSGDFYVDPDPDHLSYKPIDGTKTKVYYKNSTNTEWIELPNAMAAEHSLVGYVYTAQISPAVTNYDSADIDIKLSFTDQLGNTTILEMYPAFTVAIPVPVELASYTAQLEGNKVSLNWITASELNNKGFMIERKRDDNNWTELAFVNGAGTSSETNVYSFSDILEKEGKYSYRLKQIDYDGSYEYSQIAEVTYQTLPLQFSMQQNYPNPFNPATIIKYSIPSENNVTIKLFDVIGSEVRTLVNEVKSAGEYSLEFNAAGLANGVYFYQMNAGEFNVTRKMIIMK